METQAQTKAPGSHPSLGQVLLESKIISPEQLHQALERQKNGDGRRLGSILIDEGWLNPESLAMALSIHLNLPFIDLSRQDISGEVIRLIPEDTARRYRLIPIEATNGTLSVVMEDPTDIRVLQEISAISGMNIQPSVGGGLDIQTAIDLHYKANQEIQREVAEFTSTVEEALGVAAAIEADGLFEDPVVRAVDLILEQAIRDRASDIHIVSDHNAVRVRYRVDGILRNTLNLPSGSQYPLLSRIKIMAGMNIAERRRPQDGQFSFLISGEEVFFRVATSDTTWGEMATIRILGRSDTILGLERLGMQENTLQQYRRLIGSPFGMVLVSGPTGSGKTSTLYASINQLDRLQQNIMTIEDPVEYNFPGINQIQVNRAADITFASGLRGIMRLDPDVIMVGEVRDSETANASVQAALTGHLVMSSIHANDAAGTLYRMTHLGVERTMLTSGLLGSVSQRLIRTVCPHCTTEVWPTEEESRLYESELGTPLYRYQAGEGCTYCGHTGFLGRTGVFEILVATDEIRANYARGASSAEIRIQARQEGMTSMFHDGMIKVMQGKTTPAEVSRNVYSLE